jgi:hypothetical protein
MNNRSRAPYYRDRARGLRVSAAESKFADIQKELREVAKQFDRLADAAERRRDEGFESTRVRDWSGHWSDSD